MEDYATATIQIAPTTLRSVVGQSELDEVLSRRDELNERLRDIIEEQTEGPWGMRVTMAEVKDVLLPERLQRSMTKQAEAERERRAKVIHAQGDFPASETLAQAANVLTQHPGAMQLRYLQTLVEMAGEHTSTIIPLPFPGDILGLLRTAVGSPESGERTKS